MASTFHGLETARRGMYTQQSALQVTGHNVANANTPGYTRQRINFQQTEAYPSPAFNKPMLPGQIGTGVEAGSVQRIRDSFLDVQYRGENNKLGYWESKADALTKMEEIMNEPTDSGLAKTIDMFWQSLQDLAGNPKNPGARAVVKERGIALAETFNYLSNSISTIRQDLQNELNVTEKNANALLDRINSLNEQIAAVEPHGMVPNDLYDERDRMIDDLSQIVNITVSYQQSGGKPSAIAEGRAVISLADTDGAAIARLVDGQGVQHIDVKFTPPGQDTYVTEVTVGGKTFSADAFTSDGSLKGLMESFGMKNSNGDIKGDYPDMLKELDNLAFTFAKEFNKVHSAGMSPNEINHKNAAGEIEPVNLDINFFKDKKYGELSEANRKGFAQRIDLADAIQESIDNIANADGSDPSKATTGDGSVLLELGDLINKEFDYGLNSEMASFRNYFQVLVGGMAVKTQNALRLTDNSGTLRQSVDDKRMSVSAVSLDEEMTNMIQFQHAYNASARMISLQDELLDKIINGMGTGGR